MQSDFQRASSERQNFLLSGGMRRKDSDSLYEDQIVEWRKNSNNNNKNSTSLNTDHYHDDNENLEKETEDIMDEEEYVDEDVELDEEEEDDDDIDDDGIILDCEDDRDSLNDMEFSFSAFKKQMQNRRDFLIHKQSEMHRLYPSEYLYPNFDITGSYPKDYNSTDEKVNTCGATQHLITSHKFSSAPSNSYSKEGKPRAKKDIQKQKFLHILKKNEKLRGNWLIDIFLMLLTVEEGEHKCSNPNKNAIILFLKIFVTFRYIKTIF